MTVPSHEGRGRPGGPSFAADSLARRANAANLNIGPSPTFT